MINRFIRGADVYSNRYLHSDEKFCKEKNWNINLPPEREFKSGDCIVTDKDDTAYHIDELVTLLNSFLDENKELRHDRAELFIRERDAQNENRDLKYKQEKALGILDEELGRILRDKLANDLKDYPATQVEYILNALKKVIK